MGNTGNSTRTRRGLTDWITSAEAPDVRSERGPSPRSLRTNVLDRFDDEGELGRGGMAVVRKAFDRNIMRPVAMKILAGSGTGSVGVSEAVKFLREAQITGQLEHPHIIPVHELGMDEEGVHYLCMKLVRGQTLERRVDDLGETRLEPSNLAELLGVFMKVCDAVAFAHARGVIHRDLKPANIMIGDFGEVYVLDWGVALCLDMEPQTGEKVRVTELDPRIPGEAPRDEEDDPGALVGTPSFMAPEQTQRDITKLGPHTDIFGLGAILYYILTGRPPYENVTVWLTMVDADECRPPRPSELVPSGVPEGLETITLRAMARAPEDRYPSAMALKGDIEAFLRGAWHLARRTFAPGQTIVREGEPGTEAFIIESGRCVVTLGSGKDRRVLRELGPGDVFGETAVLSAGRRTATVEALDDVTLQVVTEDSLRAAIGFNSWVGPFVRALAERFREVDARLRTIEGGEDEIPGQVPE